MSEKLTIPPMRAMPAERRLQLRRALVVEYQRTLEQPRRRERRRLLFVAVALVGAAVLGAGAYAGYVLTRPTQHLTIGCYNGASLHADTAVVPADGRPAAAVCAFWWQRAFPDLPQPESLTACVLPYGPVGVFPAGRDVCGRLGLAPYAPNANARTQVRNLATLKDSLVNAFLDKCLDQTRARTVARRLLGRHGFGDWQIQIPQPFSDARPCASLAFDEPHRTLIVVPVPRG